MSLRKYEPELVKRPPIISQLQKVKIRCKVFDFPEDDAVILKRNCYAIFCNWINANSKAVKVNAVIRKLSTH